MAAESGTTMAQIHSAIEQIVARTRDNEAKFKRHVKEMKEATDSMNDKIDSVHNALDEKLTAVLGMEQRVVAAVLAALRKT